MPADQAAQRIEEYLVANYATYSLECIDRGQNFVRFSIPNTFPNLTYLCQELDSKFDATVTPDADSFGSYIAEIDKSTAANGSASTLPILPRTGPSPCLLVVLSVVLTLLGVGVLVLLRANWLLIMADIGGTPAAPAPLDGASSHGTDL